MGGRLSIKNCPECGGNPARRNHWRLCPSCAAKKKWNQDTKFKEKWNKSMKQVRSNPETKKKWSEANKRRYLEDPSLRTSITEAAHEALRQRTRAREAKGYFNRSIGKRGYWLIYVSGKGWLKEHHYIWEKAGRSIPPGFVLHHKDFDRLNNNLENLELMTISNHQKLHYKHRNIDKKTGRFI